MKTRASGALALQAERHADGDREAVAERAADDLDRPACRSSHARHRQPAVVTAVGLEFALGDDAGLDQRGVERNGVMAVRQQEAVAPLPVRIVRRENPSRENRRRRARRRCRGPGRYSPGPAPRPSAAPLRRMRYGAFRRAGELCPIEAVMSFVPCAARQWISMPPLTSMMAPVT